MTDSERLDFLETIPEVRTYLNRTLCGYFKGGAMQTSTVRAAIDLAAGYPRPNPGQVWHPVEEMNVAHYSKTDLGIPLNPLKVGP